MKKLRKLLSFSSFFSYQKNNKTSMTHASFLLSDFNKRNQYMHCVYRNSPNIKMFDEKNIAIFILVFTYSA